MELKMYLDMKICEPFNHFCINCKRRKSTHFLVWIGAFTCEKCATAVRSKCGGNIHCYVKNVFMDSWDDYQLRAVAHGGNFNLFTHLKDYQMETTNLIDSYYSAPLIWYRKQLVAKMDEVLIVDKKPKKKDWKD